MDKTSENPSEQERNRGKPTDKLDDWEDIGKDASVSQIEYKPLLKTAAPVPTNPPNPIPANADNQKQNQIIMATLVAVAVTCWVVAVLTISIYMQAMGTHVEERMALQARMDSMAGQHAKIVSALTGLDLAEKSYSEWITVRFDKMELRMIAVNHSVACQQSSFELSKTFDSYQWDEPEREVIIQFGGGCLAVDNNETLYVAACQHKASNFVVRNQGRGKLSVFHEPTKRFVQFTTFRLVRDDAGLRMEIVARDQVHKSCVSPYIVVRRVAWGSPASRSGVVANDGIITGINDKNVWTWQTLIHSLSSLTIGDRLQLSVARNAAENSEYQIIEVDLVGPFSPDLAPGSSALTKAFCGGSYKSLLQEFVVDVSNLVKHKVVAAKSALNQTVVGIHEKVERNVHGFMDSVKSSRAVQFLATSKDKVVETTASWSMAIHKRLQDALSAARARLG